MLTITPSESDVYTAVRAFVLAALPDGDAVFDGTIVSGVLTAANLKKISSPDAAGSIALGDAVLGLFVAPATQVAAVGTGSFTVSPTQDVDSVVMSTGVAVVQSQLNRVAEPRVQDFVMMTIVTQPRLSTNASDLADCVFTASIDGTEMTVTSVELGEIEVGAALFGAGLSPGTRVRAETSPGVYQVSPSQAVAASRLAAGLKTETFSSMVGVQLDVHGPNSSDFAMTLAAAITTSLAVEALGAAGAPISPLYCDPPRQMPFTNGEGQVENRWVIVAQLQVDYSVSLSQQFADVLTVGIVSVEAEYPAT